MIPCDSRFAGLRCCRKGPYHAEHRAYEHLSQRLYVWYDDGHGVCLGVFGELFRWAGAPEAVA